MTDLLISIRTKIDGPKHRWKIKGRDFMTREMTLAANEKRVRTSLIVAFTRSLRDSLKRGRRVKQTAELCLWLK